MYHRYQPTEGGQFRRQTVAEASTPSQKEPVPFSVKAPAGGPPPTEAQNIRSEHNAPPTAPLQNPSGFPPPRFQLPFLEKLLPNADNGDLLLLLIMLLLLSEGNEDSSSVVMTLAIFLFLQ